ncbi:MAG: hypothetical protein ACPHXV_05105, partial [Glaciecola sp.]
APSDLPLIATLPTADFHFGFSGNGQITNVEYNGQLVEQMTQTFTDGEVNVSASAGLISGRFLLPIEYASARLFYDHDGRENTAPKEVTEIPIELLPAKPQAVVITLADKTNHQYGRDNILEAGEQQQLVLTLEDRYGNRAIRWENQDTNVLLSAAVNGDAIIRLSNGQVLDAGKPVRLSRGSANISVSDESAETVILDLQDDFSGLGLAINDETLEFAKRLPAITASSIPLVHNSLLTPIEFTLTESLKVMTQQELGLEVSKDGLEVELNYSTHDEKLIATPRAPLELGACMQWNSSNTEFVGLAANDEMLAQTGQVCMGDVMIQPLTDPYVVEGRMMTVNYLAATGINSVAGSLNFINTSKSIVLKGNTFIAPSFTDLPEGSIDGEVVTMSLQLTRLKAANSAEFILLSESGDFDNDGIPNGIEYALADLHPANDDTNGNGIKDGDEDIDNDGLINREEVLQGTDLSSSDTDEDGLSDYDEAKIYNTNPLKIDTDSDGLPDSVEVVSNSDAIDPSIRIIDPAYITRIYAVDGVLNLDIKDGEYFVLNLEAVFTYNNKSFVIDISSDFDLLIFGSRAKDIAEFSVDHYQLKSAGKTRLSVALKENAQLKDTVDLFVVNSLVNDPEQLQLELVPVGDGVVYRDSNIRQISFDITGGILPSALSAATLNGMNIDIVNHCEEIQLGLVASTQGHGYLKDGVTCADTASSIGQNPYKAHRLD